MSTTTTTKAKSVRGAVLEARGWTRDLCRLHLPHGSGWFDLAEAEAAERTPAWVRDRARVEDGLPLLLSMADLKGRGWSPAMVKQFLGDPHVVVPLNRSGSRTMHLWQASVADEIEAGDEFRTRATAAAQRSAQGRAVARSRADEVLRAAEVAAKELVVVPPSSWEELVDSALDHQGFLYSLRGTDKSTGGADDETVERWCRNYLRHQCSNYDRTLYALRERFTGVPGVNDIYAEVIRPQINSHVDFAMMQLRSAAA